MKAKVDDLFSLKYYHASLSDEDLKLIEASIDPDTKTYDALSGGATGASSFSSSYTGLLAPEDWKNDTGNTLTNVLDFSKVILKHADEYLQLASKRKQYFDLTMGDCWLNKYEKGDSQELHHHCGPVSNFSGCIFLKFDKEKDAKFGFYNHNLTDYTNWYNMLCFSETAEWLYPDVSQGDIILFPSTAWHQVGRQQESTVRMTLSFNFDVIPHCDPQPLPASP